MTPESFILFCAAAFVVFCAALKVVGILLDWLVPDDEIDCGGTSP